MKKTWRRGSRTNLLTLKTQQTEDTDTKKSKNDEDKGTKINNNHKNSKKKRADSHSSLTALTSTNDNGVTSSSVSTCSDDSEVVNDLIGGVMFIFIFINEFYKALFIFEVLEIELITI